MMCDSKTNSNTVLYSSNTFAHNKKFSNSKFSWKLCVFMCVSRLASRHTHKHTQFAADISVTVLSVV